METVNMQVIRLPWYRESAFQAWVKNSLSTLVVLVAALQVAPDTWKAALAIALGSIVKDFLGSAYDIFWGGPDVYQPPPPPTDAEKIKALEEEVERLKKGQVPPPPVPPTPPPPAA